MVRAAMLMMGIFVMVLLVSNCGPRSEAAKTVGLTDRGGSYTFRFQAVAEGQATLKLIYHRPFESQTAPLKTCEVAVVVR